MDLKDLLSTPSGELTTEELEEKLNKLKRLRFRPESSAKKPSPTKSNKDKQMENLLEGLTPEQLKQLLTVLEAE